MKQITSFILLTAAAWALSGCTTTDSAETRDTDGETLERGNAKVHVIFANPDKFTDARSHLGGGADRRNLDPIGDFLVREASRHLAPGERLTVVFTDVDLAGDFEPGGLSDTGDVRIVREIQAPRLVFNFSIVDQTDTVVQEGDVTLTNRNFMRELRSPQSQQEPLYHEKELLRRWVRDTLAKRNSG